MKLYLDDEKTHALIVVFSVGWTVLTETIVLICIIPAVYFLYAKD